MWTNTDLFEIGEMKIYESNKNQYVRQCVLLLGLIRNLFEAKDVVFLCVVDNGVDKTLFIEFIKGSKQRKTQEDKIKKKKPNFLDFT